MLPTIDVFGWQLSSYVLMGCAGFFSVWLVAWLATRKNRAIEQNHVPHAALAAMGGLFVGGHLLYGLVNCRALLHAAQDHFSLFHSFYDYLFFFSRLLGGMVFYGGLFGALIGAAWYLKVVKLPLSPYMDIMAFCIPLFHGFARIGCFLGGCCYGVECRYGFVFHHSPDTTANGVTRFPVQLLESGLEFVLFAVILVLYSKRKKRGKLMYVYLLSYAVIRFCDECLRGDKMRGFVGPFSTSQFISLLVLITVPVFIAVRQNKEKKNRSADASPSEEAPGETAEMMSDEMRSEAEDQM